jgi:hypothetical protein
MERHPFVNDGDGVEKSTRACLRNFFPHYETFWQIHVVPLRDIGSIHARRGIDENFDFLAMPICSGLVVHGAGAIAVQFQDSCPTFALASLERPSFCGLRICDRNFGARNEFWNAAIGGVNQAAATILFGSYFLVALSRAFWLIRRREIALHREWMIRAFSIGLAVATIRPIIGIFFATSRFSGLTAREFFGIAFWIGFVLQLIAAEAWIRVTARTTIYPRQLRRELEPARE